jgi:hypothetical protein
VKKLELVTFAFDPRIFLLVAKFRCYCVKKLVTMSRDTMSRDTVSRDARDGH